MAKGSGIIGLKQNRLKPGTVDIVVMALSTADVNFADCTDTVHEGMTPLNLLREIGAS